MKDKIYEQIEESLKKLGIEGVKFIVDHPTDKSANADYYSNVALAAAKMVGQAPLEIAEQLQEALEGIIDQVDLVEVAGPGFLNFKLSRNFFGEKISTALKAGEKWGANDSWQGKKVVVEYTDPNPFKEFHVGHIFTNAVGESVARLFMANGADTKRVNYQGDVGLHVAKAIWGLKEMELESTHELTPTNLGNAYSQGALAYNSKDPEIVSEIKEINKKIYDLINGQKADSQIAKLYTEGKRVSLEYFETIYKTLNTEFDEYFFESEAGQKGKDIVTNYPDIFTESDGARIFDGEKYGLHTRVFLTKEGLPTYEAKELALAKMKEDRLGGYDLSVVSTGSEINEYFKVLLKAISMVYPELSEKTEHIGHGMVRLSTGKMSSRTGDVISATEFINEVTESAKKRMEESGHTTDETVATDVAVAAIKYETLKGSILQDSVFDKESALSFEGDSGPYLQYTHARIVSVLKKAEEVGVSPSLENMPTEAYDVETLIYQFPETVESALEERAPHKVTNYLIGLAGEFNSFYAEEKIADKDDEFAPYKAAVADAVRITLKNGLWMLGIKAPEAM